ncbi:MAG: hypothetical protein H6623_06520 [Bdellovibrionaceae bacterium]|nr:hypothetical protein [Pseudobdellovibrionaceae bacterium]
MRHIWKLIIFTLATQIFTGMSYAAMSAMKVVEKSSYQLAALAKKKEIDESFLYNINSIDIQTQAAGYTLVLKSPSADSSKLNTITMNFDQKGKVTGYAVDFTSAPVTNIFSGLDMATIIDLSAEAVVDHVSEDKALVDVADMATQVHYMPDNTGYSIVIQLNDSRTYTIKMDDTGAVTSKSF